MAEDAYERRRYSAVLLWHPVLTQFSRLASAAGLRDPQRIPTSLDNWTLHKAEWLSSRNHYPESRVDRDSRVRGDAFAHDFYVAFTTATIGRTSRTVALVASPYVRLLKTMVGRVAAEIGKPDLTYASVDMAHAYAEFSGARSKEREPTAQMRVRRVTLQMLSEVSLELVSLSGRNPLHSDLLEAITARRIGEPYSFGVDVAGPDGRTRVNIDRHGNAWWYLPDRDRMADVLTVIDRLLRTRLIATSKALPLERVIEDE